MAYDACNYPRESSKNRLAYRALQLHPKFSEATTVYSISTEDGYLQASETYNVNAADGGGATTTASVEDNERVAPSNERA